MTMTKDPLEKAKQTLERLQEQNTSLQKQIEAPVRGDVLYSIQGRTNPQTNTTIVDLVLLAGRRR